MVTMSCGIYKIENKINGKCYIGQSINIEKRFINHRSSIKNKNLPLYCEIREYGIENFCFCVIEECESRFLNEKETFWIKEYNSYLNGYNQDLGGLYNSHSVKICDENLKLIIELLKKSNISQGEIAKNFCVGQDTISEINTGKTRTIEGETYPIRNNKLNKKQNFCGVCGNKISNDAIFCNKHSHKSKKPEKEYLYNLLKNNSFECVGRMFCVSGNAVKKWCLSYNIPSKSIYYKDIKKIKNKRTIKEVIQCDKSGNIIKIFKNISEASEWLINKEKITAKRMSICGNIYRVASGERKSAYNYVWKWVESPQYLNMN